MFELEPESPPALFVPRILPIGIVELPNFGLAYFDKIPTENSVAVAVAGAAVAGAAVAGAAVADCKRMLKRWTIYYF